MNWFDHTNQVRRAVALGFAIWRWATTPQHRLPSDENVAFWTDVEAFDEWMRMGRKP